VGSPGLGSLGLGLGWRPELALLIDRHPDLGFVELLAEGCLAGLVPEAVDVLRERGVVVVPHGVSLSLGGAAPVDRAKVRALARLARRVGAPCVSEHVAFVRAGGRESGHLLPVPRTREALGVIAANVREARAILEGEAGVPLALENVAALFEWPGAELSEGELLAALLEATGAQLLLDLANLHASATNLGWDARATLDALPLERLAYVHVAGGVRRGALYHDTHAHPAPQAVADLVEALCARTTPPGLLLERDDRFPPDAELAAELTGLARAAARGAARREPAHV
jgi:uncharacterized protein (UPF0276 family)